MVMGKRKRPTPCHHIIILTFSILRIVYGISFLANINGRRSVNGTSGSGGESSGSDRDRQRWSSSGVVFNNNNSTPLPVRGMAPGSGSRPADAMALPSKNGGLFSFKVPTLVSIFENL
jgi:hypothetical protein